MSARYHRKGKSTSASKDTRHAGNTVRGVAAGLGLAAVTVLGGCESFSLFGGGKSDQPAQIREVTTLKAPFYDSQPKDDSIPFIYLTEGTAVEWLKEDASFAKVRLANGAAGWVPSASLGSSSYGSRAELAAPGSEPGTDTLDGSRSTAVHSAPGDDSLEKFNVP